MDLETQAQLTVIEGQLNKSLTEAFEKIVNKIDSQFNRMESSIQNLFNKDIEYLKEQNKSWKNQHEQHFQEVKDVRKEMSRLKEDIEKDVRLFIYPIQEKINDLERRQTTDEGQAVGKAVAEESFMKKNGATIGIIGIVLTAVTIIVSIFIYLGSRT